MIKVSKGACIGLLSIAVIGYVTYRVVQWTINKCPSSDKAAFVAKKNLGSLPSCSDKITMGQGEYVVFQNGGSKELSQKLFEKVYEILIQYSPTAIINSGSDQAVEMCKNRYELIQSKVQEIDPNLEVAFVPRTLYELFFIRKCIEEDIENKKICRFLLPSAHKDFEDFLANPSGPDQEYLESLKKIREMQKCWHLCCFDDDADNKHRGVKDVAYRLNQVMVQALSPSKNGFTYQEISAYAEKEITFLKNRYQKREETRRSIDKLNVFPIGPTISFTQESNYGSIKAMGIRNDTDAQIIKEAVRLDCSDTAKHSLFLYRGGCFQEDSVSSYDGLPYSLSYGTSLFAGCVYDGGATAFHYMRNQPNGYAIPVPFDQLNTSVFHIPPLHTVAQLFGNGDFFHARTKIWQGFNPYQELRGIMATHEGKNQRECLKSDLAKEDFIALFQKYKNTAIQLKHSYFSNRIVLITK